MATDKGVAKIRRDLVLAEAELAELLTRYLEKHPKAVQKRGKIESLKDGFANAEKRVFESIVNKAQLAKATTMSLLIELRQRKSHCSPLFSMNLTVTVSRFISRLIMF